MEWGVWVSIASICAAGAMSPGPSLAVVVRNTVQGGRAQGVMTGVGHGLGVGGYALVAVLGLAVFFEAFPTATRAVELAGAGYLVWLGIAALRHAGQGDMGLAEGGSSRGFSFFGRPSEGRCPGTQSLLGLASSVSVPGPRHAM